MICKRCKVDKPIHARGRCVGCEKYVIDYYAANKEREIARAQKSLKKKSRAEINAYRKEHNRKYPLRVILMHARKRAREKNIPFDLAVEDLVIPQFCPVLGIELCVNDGYAQHNSISLDRVIPELGYVKGNVAIISYRANTIKGDSSIEDLEKVLVWLKGKLLC